MVAFDRLQLNTETPLIAKWKANSTTKTKLHHMHALVCNSHRRNLLSYRFLGLTLSSCQKKCIIYLYFLAVLGICCCKGFPLVVVSRGYSSCGAQISYYRSFFCCRAQALGMWASIAVVPRLQSTGSIVVAHRLSSYTACGILPDQGSNPCLLLWQVDSLPLSQQGSPPTTSNSVDLEGGIGSAFFTSS